MKGHLGTIGCHKCSEVFSVEIQKYGLFKVREIDSRNRPIYDFSFKISEVGISFVVKLQQYEE